MIGDYAGLDPKQEWLKCRKSPFYFIHNYYHFEEIGGYQRYTIDKMHYKFRAAIRILLKYHRCILMASRQLGKSTLAAAILLWTAIFFPGSRIVILNFRKSTAFENIDKIKFAHSLLPPFFRVPIKSGVVKSYIEFSHGSRISAFYPSSTTPPEQLARSLTASVIYIDEAAFIRGIEEAYKSAQPVLSKAREQARRYGYPYFIFITSTPNGTEGEGRWFFEMWSNAVDSDMMITKDGKLSEGHYDIYTKLVNEGMRNSFVRIRYHWSEDPSKNEEWYREQCRELNWDEVAISQELDLEFVPPQTCVFPPSIMSAIHPQTPKTLLDFDLGPDNNIIVRKYSSYNVDEIQRAVI